MFKKIMICVVFVVVSAVSCSRTYKKIDESKSECEQILNVVTDCMGLHRGAFEHISNCGDASIERIKQLKNCDDILNYLEND